MKRNTKQKIVNPLLPILLANQVLTGVFGFSLPPGWFPIMHKGGGYLLAVIALLHLGLNWNWVSANYFKKR
jgi:hypothetical protein